MARAKAKRPRIVYSYSLAEIRDALASLSRGGHPDDFIPYEAKVQIVNGRIELSWDE